MSDEIQEINAANEMQKKIAAALASEGLYLLDGHTYTALWLKMRRVCNFYSAIDGQPVTVTLSLTQSGTVVVSWQPKTNKLVPAPDKTFPLSRSPAPDITSTSKYGY
ncbi:MULTISPECIES: hypothetical protein [Enterobacterales]|uniref:Uncharacterized protein n=4 Tax=Enterobacteriaceae TaxID=543 RepID=A0AAN5QW98_CITFR|nr:MULTISPECIES: hypothetical protein [Enterobacteriaceae]EBF7093043.1 hypothetical protein [Salmonella enterica subsp. enterica serovar Liverpool]EDW1832196.1 hypothetical protein [Salmonella enterica subsp. enterica serovar Soerenga]EED9259825.1 hypothetical protein [Salmonella enterica subsp. enterica serovar Goldcoast]EGW8368835.1 hypothetical protein [Salmonella enterica]EHK0948160.1 hypothetical protein [Citrobacter farmeri]HDK6615799.1 hypothetical protein [Klebsiella variicola]HDR284